MQKSTSPIIGTHFFGPTGDSVAKWPDPEVGWHTDMANAVGVEGVVTEVDFNNSYLVRLKFPSCGPSGAGCSWWYTIGALTNRVEDPKYHEVIISGESYWITTPALENLKAELGIPGPVALNA